MRREEGEGGGNCDDEVDWSDDDDESQPLVDSSTFPRANHPHPRCLVPRAPTSTHSTSTSAIGGACVGVVGGFVEMDVGSSTRREGEGEAEDAVGRSRGRGRVGSHDL